MTEASSPSPSDDAKPGGCACGCSGEQSAANSDAAAAPVGKETIEIRERKPEEYRLQGHTLLAKMGKRVLRPGGLELTKRLIEHSKPTADDRIVEFGPGLGSTAELLLAAGPNRYFGIDPSSPDVGKLQEVLAAYPNTELIKADAKDTGLPDETATLVVGEAMLTMQPLAIKAAIIAESFRLLEPGGRYAIHELGFKDSTPQEDQKEVAKVLSRTIKVGARPLTLSEWSELFEQAGFVVEYSTTNPMHLLEPKRLIADEGFAGAARFAANVARNKAARERIKKMRAMFRKNEDSLNAVALVLRKPTGNQT